MLKSYEQGTCIFASMANSNITEPLSVPTTSEGLNIQLLDGRENVLKPKHAHLAHSFAHVDELMLMINPKHSLSA